MPLIRESLLHSASLLYRKRSIDFAYCDRSVASQVKERKGSRSRVESRESRARVVRSVARKARADSSLSRHSERCFSAFQAYFSVDSLKGEPSKVYSFLRGAQAYFVPVLVPKPLYHPHKLLYHPYEVYY